MGGIEAVDLDRMSPAERIEHWQEVVSASYLDVTSRPDTDADPRPFRGRARRLWIDDIAILDCTCMPCQGERGRHRVAAAGGEYVGVLQIRRGTERVAQDSQDFELRPGAAVSWDSRRPIVYAVPTVMTKRNVFLPVPAVEEAACRSWRGGMTSLSPAAPATQLLLAYLDVLARTGAGLEGAAATAARNAMLELFVGAVSNGTTPQPPAAMRALLDEWIDRRLRRDLTPAAIADAHGISVRTAHRLYEATGETLGGYIRNRRLEVAYSQVVASAEPVAVIARRWRFASSSHFTRAFRARYGTTPTELRACAVPRLEVPAQPAAPPSELDYPA
jgi:AraC family transcriptional regulator, positive regulator of tynA and feaB